MVSCLVRTLLARSARTEISLADSQFSDDTMEGCPSCFPSFHLLDLSLHAYFWKVLEEISFGFANATRLKGFPQRPFVVPPFESHSLMAASSASVLSTQFACVRGG